MKKFDILQEKKLMICAHMGSCGGLIPGNTITAFDIAIRQGADMIELDVTKSVDGELFVFHPKTENRVLKKDIDIRTMTAAEIRELLFVSPGGGYTYEPIQHLDDVFEHLKGRCYINVDKFADNPCEIMEMVKKHGMLDQIVVKSAPTAEVLQSIAEVAPEVAYLTIINDNYDPYAVHAELMRRNMNYVGIEVVFKDDNSLSVSEDFRATVHRDGRLLWGNAILFDARRILAGVHSDDTALRGDPDLGWGWFADHGFDIVQTDWVRELKLYLDGRK